MMMNRQQRRAVKKALPRYKRESQGERIARIEQHGIRLDDLDREYDRGYKHGYAAGVESAMRTCYGALALAAHDTYGFGRVRSLRLLQKLDEHVVNTVVSEDVIRETEERYGYKIAFTEPFDRVEEL